MNTTPPAGSSDAESPAVQDRESNDAHAQSTGLRKGLAQAFVLHGLGVGLLFAMHVAAARLLDTEGYGALVIGLAIVSMVGVVTTLGFPSGALRFVAGYRARSQWALLAGVIRSMAAGVLVASLIAACILLVCGWLFEGASGIAEGMSIAAWILVPVAFGLFRSQVSQGLDKIPGAIIPEQILLPLFVVASLVIAATFKGQPISAIESGLLYGGGATLAIGIGVIWLLRSLPDEARHTTPEYRFREWITTSLPMMLGAFLQTGLNRTDVLILGAVVSLEETGMYNAASRLSLLCVFMLRAVDKVIGQRIAAAHHKGDRREIKRVLFRGTLISLAGGGAAFIPLVLAPEALMSLFGVEYVQGANLLVVLAGSQMVNAATGPVGYALLMTGHQRVFAAIQATAFAASILLIFVLVSDYGVMGAAIAVAISTVALNIGLWICVRVKVLRTG